MGSDALVDQSGGIPRGGCPSPNTSLDRPVPVMRVRCAAVGWTSTPAGSARKVAAISLAAAVLMLFDIRLTSLGARAGHHLLVCAANWLCWLLAYARLSPTGGRH